MISLGRYAKFMADGDRLTAFCAYCPRSGDLDLAELMAAGFIGQVRRVVPRCLRCGNEGQLSYHSSASITTRIYVGRGGVTPRLGPEANILAAGIEWVEECRWPPVPPWVRETNTRWEHDIVCGRYAFYSPHEAVRQWFPYRGAPNLQPRYNIAPTQTAAVIRADAEGWTVDQLRWGLTPFWAKEVKIGATMINARAETVMQKPGFRNAFGRQHCLVLADGYYEWRDEGGERKQPYYYFSMKDGRPFVFAGLWERNDKATGEPIESFTIITTTPNELQAPIHDRMPVILSAAAAVRWLQPFGQPADAFSCLGPYPAEEMKAHPVSTIVGSPKNDVPECVVPVPPA